MNLKKKIVACCVPIYGMQFFVCFVETKKKTESCFCVEHLPMHVFVWVDDRAQLIPVVVMIVEVYRRFVERQMVFSPHALMGFSMMPCHCTKSVRVQSEIPDIEPYRSMWQFKSHKIVKFQYVCECVRACVIVEMEMKLESQNAIWRNMITTTHRARTHALQHIYTVVQLKVKSFWKCD